MSDFNVVAGKATIDKDPDALLDYTIDFTSWLVGTDTIQIATAIASANGVTVQDTVVVSGKKVTLWLSGGTAGTKVSVTVRVQTVAGRTDDRTVYFKITER
jgi:hypothetical protein